MLTCIRKGFDLLDAALRARATTLATVPAEDARPSTTCSAGPIRIGVFQVESRAQMTMLPRLQPRKFYDLVIEVAIVRPGPIQGDMVHPYLRRRNGEEQVGLSLGGAARRCSGKTLGVPLFQEQAMQIAIVGGRLHARRGRPAAPRHGDLPHGRARSRPSAQKFIAGMVARGYERDFAERCFQPDRGLRRIRLPREPRGELRAARLCLGLAQVPLSGGVRLRAAQQPADGLLRAGADRARRARAWRRGAAGPMSIFRIGTARSSPPRTHGRCGWACA